MKRKFCLILECDTEGSFNFIQSDIEQELGCAANDFNIVSFEEMNNIDGVCFGYSERFLQSC